MLKVNSAILNIILSLLDSNISENNQSHPCGESSIDLHRNPRVNFVEKQPNFEYLPYHIQNPVRLIQSVLLQGFKFTLSSFI